MYINQEQPREITGSGGYKNTLSFKFLDAICEVYASILFIVTPPASVSAYYNYTAFEL